MELQTRTTKQLGIEVPLFCGAMYPCSNPELIAAVSEAGGIGIVQPISLVYVHGYDFKKGLEKIRMLTQKPIGMNILLEKGSSQLYENRMRTYLEIGLEMGIRFFITALGNPTWVLKRVHASKGIVYHDVVNRMWAEKALNYGVDGLICVNNRAGGHAGTLSPEEMYAELSTFNVPLVCAGGIGDEEDFIRALKLGYDAVQMGTRFIATNECSEKEDYKQAIINAEEKDIVLTERVTGIPLSVIKTPYVEKIGTKVGPLARYLLQNPRTKHWMRTFYVLRSARQFKKISLHGGSSKDYWQAGKSVAHIHSIENAGDIVRRFANCARTRHSDTAF